MLNANFFMTCCFEWPMLRLVAGCPPVLGRFTWRGACIVLNDDKCGSADACGLPDGVYLVFQTLQASGMQACLHIPERRLSYAKILK